MALVWQQTARGLLAANHGSSCSLTRAMDGRIVRCGIISSCQSAYSCKRRYSKYPIFTFTFTLVWCF